MKTKALFRWLELYINQTCRQEMETYYGEGSKIKFKSVSESIKEKTLLFEAVVVLGDKIDENILESEFAHILICDAISMLHIFPGEPKIKTLITWDS